MEVAQNRMRSVHRTFRRVCRSQIHISLKIGADSGFALSSDEQYVISNKDMLCNMVSRAYVSATFAKSRIKFKTQTNFTDRTSTLMTYSVQIETPNPSKTSEVS